MISETRLALPATPPKEMKIGNGTEKEIYEYMLDDLNGREICRVFNVISSGGATNPANIIPTLEDCKSIGVLKAGRLIISVCTIKRPEKDYVYNIFSSSGNSNPSIHFKHELGYLATLPGFRRMGYCAALLNVILPKVDYPIFATTRSKRVENILRNQGFRRYGQEWNDGLFLLVKNFEDEICDNSGLQGNEVLPAYKW